MNKRVLGAVLALLVTGFVATAHAERVEDQSALWYDPDMSVACDYAKNQAKKMLHTNFVEFRELYGDMGSNCGCSHPDIDPSVWMCRATAVGDRDYRPGRGERSQTFDAFSPNGKEAACKLATQNGREFARKQNLSIMDERGCYECYSDGKSGSRCRVRFDLHQR